MMTRAEKEEMRVKLRGTGTSGRKTAGTVPEDILKVEYLCKWFPIKKKTKDGKRQYVKAVDNVSFSVRHGETLGIVGESGCGKSTLGRTMIKLLQPSDGQIFYEGIDVTFHNDTLFRQYRKNIQIMFQDPYASLDPRMTIGDIIAEPMDVQKMYPDKRKRLERIVELMDLCGLNKDYINRYPHEFSGGQRQRIGIARALSVNPKLIICDEPVSALDVSIQSQIINLLMEIQKKFQLSLVFISHDLSVVHHIADRVMVMYLGKIVELADKEELFEHPLHPYTQALLSAIPVVGEASFDQMQILEGELPSPINPPEGCPFHTRCPKAVEECSRKVPELKEVRDGHSAACMFL